MAMTTQQRMAKAEEFVAKNYSDSWWNESEKQIAAHAYLAGTYCTEE